MMEHQNLIHYHCGNKACRYFQNREVRTHFENDLCAGCKNVMQIEALKDPMINKPPHYTKHPSGVECIDVTQHLNFCMGNAVKYIWRADLKGDPIADLKKAAWYIEKELERRNWNARSVSNHE